MSKEHWNSSAMQRRAVFTNGCTDRLGVDQNRKCRKCETESLIISEPEVVGANCSSSSKRRERRVRRG